MGSLDLFLAVLWFIYSTFAAIVSICLLVVSCFVKERSITDVLLSSYVFALLLRVTVIVSVEASVYLALFSLTKTTCQVLMWWQHSMQIVHGMYLLSFSITGMFHFRKRNLSSSAKYTAHGTGVSVIIWIVGHCATVPMALVLTVDRGTKYNYFGQNGETCFFQEIGQFFQWNLFVLVFSCFVTAIALVCVIDAVKCWQSLTLKQQSAKTEQTQLQTIDSQRDSIDSNQQPLSTISNVSLVTDSVERPDVRRKIRSEYRMSCLVMVIVALSTTLEEVPNAVFAAVNIGSLASLRYSRFAQLWLLIAHAILLPFMVVVVSPRYREASMRILHCSLFRRRESSANSDDKSHDQLTRSRLNGHQSQVPTLNGISFIVDTTDEVDAATTGPTTDDESGFDENTSSAKTSSQTPTDPSTTLLESHDSSQPSTSKMFYFGGLKRLSQKQTSQVLAYTNKGFQSTESNNTYVSSSYHPDCMLPQPGENPQQCEFKTDAQSPHNQIDNGKSGNDTSSDCETGSDEYGSGDIAAVLGRLSLVASDVSSAESTENEVEYGDRLLVENETKTKSKAKSKDGDNVSVHSAASRLSQREQADMFAHTVRELEKAIKHETTAADFVKDKITNTSSYSKETSPDNPLYETNDEKNDAGEVKVEKHEYETNAANDVATYPADEDPDWPPPPPPNFDVDDNLSSEPAQSLNDTSNSFYFTGFDNKSLPLHDYGSIANTVDTSNETFPPPPDFCSETAQVASSQEETGISMETGETILIKVFANDSEKVPTPLSAEETPAFSTFRVNLNEATTDL